MGTKYALLPIEEDSPTHVEGHRLWIRSKAPEGSPCTVVVIVIYWDGQTELARRLIEFNKLVVEDNGGTYEQWKTVHALAENSSDIDDVMENMIGMDWGKSLLWGCWHAVLAR